MVGVGVGRVDDVLVGVGGGVEGSTADSHSRRSRTSRASSTTPLAELIS